MMKTYRLPDNDTIPEQPDHEENDSTAHPPTKPQKRC